MITIGVDAHSLEGFRTGARGRYLFNLVKEWANMKLEGVEFIFYFWQGIPPEPFLNHPHFRKKILRLPFKKQSFTLYYNLLLPRAAKKDKVSICFFPFYMLPLTYRASNAVVTIHDVVFEAHPEWFSPRHYLPLHHLTRNAALHAKRVLTISEFSKKEIIKYYKIDPEKIDMIYLGADTLFGKREEGAIRGRDIDEVKSSYRIHSRPYIFFVGSIFNRRHIPESIDAFVKLGKEVPELCYLISGRNLTRPWIDIDAYIRSANDILGGERIIRVDYVSDGDLRVLYQNASMVLYLSSYEGFGLPVLEAMASGRPVLTTLRTSIGEIVGDYPGAVGDPEDSDELYRHMRKIISDGSYQRHLIEQGEKVTAQYSWEITARNTLDVFVQSASIW